MMSGGSFIFILISFFLVTPAKGATTVTDEHLIAVGNNNEDGNGVLTVTSKLATSVTTFTLNGHSISSACGTHPSRCRELMVQSTRLSDLTTKHMVMIPLENGLQLLEFHHNGTSNDLSIISQHTLMFSGINDIGNCSSLNAYQIGATYYVPCITRESLYVCVLTLNTTDITQSSIQSCRQMPDIGAAEFTSLSNIVLSDDTFLPQQHLLFLVQNRLYSLFPITSVLSFVDDFSRICSQINQLLLSPRGDGELLLYCSDRHSIVYSTDIDQIVNFGGLENVQYPCSPSAEFIIHLNRDQMDLSYKLRSNGSDTVQISLSPTISNEFHSGICFDNGDHHFFTYIDRSVGVFLFNATSRNFTLLPNTCCCAVGEDCELILVYNNRYLVVRNREQRRVSVHDILQSRAIIILQDRPFSLLSLIHDIQVVDIPTEPTTTNMDAMNTLPSDVIEEGGPSLSPGAITAIVIVIVVLFTAIIAVIIIVVFLRRQRNSAQYSPTQVQVSDDAAIQGSMVSSEQADHSEANETSLNQSQPAVKSEDEVIQLSTSMTPAAAADHEDPHDTETVERTVIGESDTNFQTEFEDTEVVGKQTEISPKEPDVSIVKVEEEASDTSNTQRLESDDRTTNPNEDSEVSSNQDSHSSTIAATDKDEDKPSDTDSRQSQSSSTPKTVQQRLKENAGVNSQVAVSEEKTDSLYPLRTHFIQVKDSKDETAISGD